MLLTGPDESFNRKFHISVNVQIPALTLRSRHRVAGALAGFVLLRGRRPTEKANEDFSV